MRDDHDDHKKEHDEEMTAGKAVDHTEAEAPEHRKEQAEEKPTPKEPEAAQEHHQHSDSGAPANIFKRFWHWAMAHKQIAIPSAVVIVLALLAVIPFTRYSLAGLVIKQQFHVVVMDSETEKPVSNATVTLGGQTATTDGEGQAEVRAKVGNQNLMITKKYYEDYSHGVLVPLGKQKEAYSAKLVATGRAVPVTVNNSITKQPLGGITITAGEVVATTDESGKALVVLPPDQATATATLSGEGYNNIERTITITADEVPENTLTVTPSGKIFFLSNQSGNIDVVKTNLDGTEREVVVAGTGEEDRSNTTLLASRDWQYLALHSKRDGGDNAKLFLIDAATGELTIMDEGNATFESVGWSGHYFIYKVKRHGLDAYAAKRETIKSYNAETKKITALADTDGSGGSNYYNHFVQQFDSVTVLDDVIFYVVNFNAYPASEWADKQSEVRAVKPDGSSNQLLAGYKVSDPSSWLSNYINARVWGPKEVYYTVNSEEDKLFEFEDGSIKQVEGKTDDDLYGDNYFTYLVSPSGEKTFWAEQRDGKTVLFVGNDEGEDGQQIDGADEHNQYGWFTDDYLLVSKKGSELFILPAAAPATLEDPLKISDYYRSGQTFSGYGYGYGGI